jgi:hypothetical protein
MRNVQQSARCRGIRLRGALSVPKGKKCFNTNKTQRRIFVGGVIEPGWWLLISGCVLDCPAKQVKAYSLG